MSSSGEAAQAFYDERLDDDVVMLLPGGLVLDDREEAVRSMSGKPWSSYELADMRVVPLRPDAGIVAYAVRAWRDDAAPYSALVSSTYVRRDDGWRLAFHQQTPR